MPQPVIQTSFVAGEWAPALNARVDLAKYHSGAALLLNFFVDYRGGATTRPGTRFVLPCFRPLTQVRLIPFQASLGVGYVVEFGNLYIRFFNNSAPILENATNISAASGSPVQYTDTAHGYVNGDWVFIAGSYYIVGVLNANTFQLADLQGNVITTNPFTIPNSAFRVYTVPSPYLSTELSQIKYSQNVNQLILCHPNHPPTVLTLNSILNWTIAPIVFGATIATPTGQSVATTLAAGTVSYSYVITAVDANGQESPPSGFASLGSLTDIRSTPGTNTVTWTAVTGAASYNVYRAEPSYAGGTPAGSQFGFQGNCTGNHFIDSNIAPDFSQTPPVAQNPFSGAGVQSVTLGVTGNYTGVQVPSVGFSGGGGSGAAAIAYAGLSSVVVSGGGSKYQVGDTLSLGYGASVVVTSITFGGVITAVAIVNQGAYPTGAPTPTSLGPYGSLPDGGSNAVLSPQWGLVSVGVTNPGTGYVSAPTVSFSSGIATATATIGAGGPGNPTVPGFFNQRLILAGPLSNPQLFNMSQPGSQFNFNTSNPITATDAITASLVSGRLNAIKSMAAVPAGLIMFSDQQAWLLNGGSPGAPISALAINANSQSYNGASDLPAIIANANILYVQAKSSIVRDLAYNFYTNVYAGTNISILSSHLFFGFTLLEWCWAEEPFKLVWAVRSDGDLLSCTYQKEQEMVAWSHHTTVGAFKSIATITEVPATGPVDAVYVVTQRFVNGQTVQYIERLVDLQYPNGFISSWYVDAGINFTGSPATNFSGAQHLGGLTVTGVADGAVIPPFTMPANGSFTLGTPASNVTVGIPILGQIQTLALDLGEPTAQGKRKKVSAVTVRAANTLGISAGRTVSTLVPMKDFIIGNVGTMSNTKVTDLVTSDGRVIMDPQWDVFGQFVIQQSLPYPASVLGVIPEIEVGDDA